MASEAPPFWWEKPDWKAFGLWPASKLYGAVAGRRLAHGKREPVDAPVLCIGNFTVGGTGKTPVAIAMAKAAREKGLKPGILSRGHGGGSFPKPHLVNVHHDIAKHVGDEPILLAEHAPVAVTPDRAAGARALIEQGCDFLIMDDGFQSARIMTDYALLVIDAARGLGNGHVIPGGPLRAPLVVQMREADALLRMGEGSAADRVIRQAARAGRPIFSARTRIAPGQDFAGQRFVAFAGIGHNIKFFDTVRAAGGDVVAEKSFADHHIYSDDDLNDLDATAALQGAQLVTTEKDLARLRGQGGEAKAILPKLRVLRIETEFEDAASPARILAATLQAYKARRLAKA